MLIYFSGGGILATHMLMNGSWHIYRPGERWQQPAANMRIVIETSDFVAVGFSVPVAEMHTAQSLARERRIPPATSDVLGRDFDASSAVESLLASGDLELGEALLRQKVLAGVGNVFKSEICFAAGLHPFRKVATLTREQAAEVVSIARRQLGSNVLEESGRPDCDLSRAETAHHAPRRSGREPVGLRTHGRAVPALRRTDPQAAAGWRCAGHVLVSPLPAYAGWQSSGRLNDASALLF